MTSVSHAFDHADRRLVLGDDLLFRRLSENAIELHWEFFWHVRGMVSERIIVSHHVDADAASHFADCIDDIERDFNFDCLMYCWGDPQCSALTSLVSFLRGGGFKIVESDESNPLTPFPS